MEISISTVIILSILGALFLWGYMKRGSIFSGRSGIKPSERAKRKTEAQDSCCIGGAFSSGGFGEFDGVRRPL